MSDCSTNSFDVAPIRGEIHWRGGMRPTTLSYARYVNGQERMAEWVELDGVRYVPECGLRHMVDTRNESIRNLVGVLDKRQERIGKLGIGTC